MELRLTNKMVFKELNSHDLSEENITMILYNLTGYVYTFAVSTSMRWGKYGNVEEMGDIFPDGFVQLMPRAQDDGFFDWYCYHREDQQFFVSRETCALHFIHYWMRWVSIGKPSPF